MNVKTSLSLSNVMSLSMVVRWTRSEKDSLNLESFSVFCALMWHKHIKRQMIINIYFFIGLVGFRFIFFIILWFLIDT